MSTPPRILHLHPSLEGPVALRCARLINAFGRDADHAIVSGDPARRGAAAALQGKAKVSWPKFPALPGKPWPGRLKKLAEAMQGYDLVCTYGWGAIDAALAHTMFADVFKLAPLVHHEDDAAGRTFYRRIALGRTRVLVVPSRTLERIALEGWQQPRSRVRRIPAGIATKAFGGKAKPSLLPNLIKRRGELWVGTFGDTAGATDLPAIVRAFAGLPEEWHLVIAGATPGREAILGEARAKEIEHRVHLVGDVERVGLTALLDVFVLAPSTDTFPLALLEAMAAGLPVAAPARGDVSAMVATENLPFVVAPDNEAALGEAMAALARDARLRESVGYANKKKAREEFDETRMIERFRSLYWSVLPGNPA
ncbi:MAG: glycosyltransferase family 4 protein [Croceibacterium sp.]